MRTLKPYSLYLVMGLLCSTLTGCAALFVGSAATTAVVAQDRRTTGTIIEDKTIQFKATQLIHEMAEKNRDLHVSAISYNTQVLLVGQAPSPKIRSELERRIQQIKKVRQLHNEIELEEPTSSLQRSNDAWITTKIKTQMTLTKDLNPTRVKVTTENGVVYLLGIVTPLEEEITVDIARHTRGVSKVVKIFEYEK